MSFASASEPEPDEGNGPIVTIRDNMIALAILIVIAATSIFVTNHNHPWQLSGTRPVVQVTSSRITTGCWPSGRALDPRGSCRPKPVATR